MQGRGLDVTPGGKAGPDHPPRGRFSQGLAQGVAQAEERAHESPEGQKPTNNPPKR